MPRGPEVVGVILPVTIDGLAVLANHGFADPQRLDEPMEAPVRDSLTGAVPKFRIGEPPDPL